MAHSPVPYALFATVCVLTLKEVNRVVRAPYMDEPFHVPQAQAYCNGEYAYWDPKITTPPGLYVLTLLLRRVFLFKCTLPMLRLTPALALLLLPLPLARVLAFHKRRRAPALGSPPADAVVLAGFPVLWFFGFLYYTETVSVLGVVACVCAAVGGWHWVAALLGAVSCTFRQTNIVWVLYAFAASQLMHLRFRPSVSPSGRPLPKLEDPMARDATPYDLVRIARSAPGVVREVLPAFVPYAIVLALFGAFVVWNGGIVLGDKSNHIPALHVPQLYYFVAFASAFGWPVLVSGPGGLVGLLREVRRRMVGTRTRTAVSIALSAGIAASILKFTIHHPFLLADNRHYTFYIWHRLVLPHPFLPPLLAPLYVALTHAWHARLSADQTLLQVLLLPLCAAPTLLPTPLLEPRYFIVPYVLLRAQAGEVPAWAVGVEGVWYGVVNAVAMGVFLYREREGVGRFMW